MDDHIRISDADRDRVADKLRDHFAEGRLSREELDERVAATLSAKTAGDLRAIMADLPASGIVPSREQQPAPPWQGMPVTFRYRRGPRLLPLVALAVIAAVLIPSAGGVFLAFAKFVLVFWLVACLAGLILARRFGWRGRRGWWDGPHHHGRGGRPGSLTR
jgi:hypothetical protein